jgi:hypothetical protein
MRSNLGSLSLGNLMEMLHNAITKAAHELERIVEVNSSEGVSEVEELRDHIEGRLKNETEPDTKYDKETLKIIDLFLTDKYVLEFIKEDSEEWIDFINAIKGAGGSAGMGRKDREKLENAVEKLETILRS